MDLLCILKNLIGIREVSLFLTHTPWAFQPGMIENGYKITRLVESPPGYGCFEVYGVKEIIKCKEMEG